MSPAQELGYACRLAREHGMFVVEKGAEHILYRRTPGRPVRLGKRGDASDFRRFVEKCAGLKPGKCA